MDSLLLPSGAPASLSNSPRRYCAFSGERCWPSQNTAFSRSSLGERSSSAMRRTADLAALAALLHQGEDRLLAQVRRHRARLEHLTSACAARSVFTWPSQNTAFFFTSWLGSSRTTLEQDVLRLARALLRHEEHRLLAQLCGAGIALGQHRLEDRHRVLGAHLHQRVERFGALVVAVAARAGLLGGGPTLLGDPLRRIRIAESRQRAVDTHEQRVAVAARRRACVFPALPIEHLHRLAQLAGLADAIQRVRLPVERVARVRRLRVALHDAARRCAPRGDCRRG